MNKEVIVILAQEEEGNSSYKRFMGLMAGVSE